MSASRAESIEFALPEQSQGKVAPQVGHYDWKLPGTGIRNERCDVLQTWWHPIPGEPDPLKGRPGHRDKARYRCKRMVCPVCWNKPRGAVDLRMRRIEGQFLPKSEQDDKEYERGRILELTLSYADHPEKALQAGPRRDLFRAFERMFWASSLMKPRGVYLLHHDTYENVPEDPKWAPGSNSCPSRVHIHAWVILQRWPARFDKDPVGWISRNGVSVQWKVQRDLGATRGIVVRHVERLRTPLPHTPRCADGKRAKPYPRVQVVGYVGRPKVEMDWLDKEIAKEEAAAPVEKTRFCRLCEKDLPLKEWMPVQSEDEGEEEGTVVSFEADNRLLVPRWIRREDESAYLNHVEQTGEW